MFSYRGDRRWKFGRLNISQLCGDLEVRVFELTYSGRVRGGIRIMGKIILLYTVSLSELVTDYRNIIPIFLNSGDVDSKYPSPIQALSIYGVNSRKRPRRLKQSARPVLPGFSVRPIR